MTAKAGRPDVNRAGNHSQYLHAHAKFHPAAEPSTLDHIPASVLRAIAEARIPWSFRPPPIENEPTPTLPPGDGIWLGQEYSPFHQANDPLQTDAPHELSSDEMSESSDEGDDDESATSDSAEAESDEYLNEDDEPAGLVNKKAKANVGSMFGALEIEGVDEESEEDATGDEEGDDEESGDGEGSDAINAEV